MPHLGIRPTLLLAPFALAVLGACGDMAVPSAPAGPTDPQFAAQPVKGTWTVTTLEDPGVGSCTSSYCSLRQAVAAAQPFGRVVFKSTLKGTVALTSSIQLGKPLQVDGGGRITLDAQGKDIVLSVFSEGVEVSGFTLTGGSLGAINVLSGFLTLRSSTVTGNTSVFGGGGIRNLGTLTVINSSITNNTTPTDGAGIWSNGGTLTVVSSTIAGNTASGYGGGIWVTSTGNASVTSSTISGNSAGRIGGGIYNYGAGTTIRSSAIVTNIAPGAGGGVGIEAPAGETGSIVFANSIIAGNSGSDCDNETPGAAEIRSIGYSLSSTGTMGCFFLYPTSASPTDVFIDPTQLYTDVLDVELKNNGGPTKTHALIERGRAVDAGSCPGELTDQRGLTRPYDDARIPNAWDACDIGPFEWLPPVSAGRKK
jgi:CSLREA domain-containing protein